MRMKGQTEIVGLVVIVMLLLFTGLLYLKFSATDSDNLDEIRTNVKAANLLSSITKLTIKGKSFGDHLIDCKLSGRCSDLREEIPKIIAASGLQKNQAYMFTVSSGDANLIEIGNCSTGIASNMPIAREGVSFEITLKICEK